MTRNFQHILVWLSVAGLVWLAGAFVQDAQRLLLWSLALAIDLAAPWAGYWVPGFGRSTTTDWDVEGGHMAERCALFIIIALGESLLVTGATFAGLPWTTRSCWPWSSRSSAVSPCGGCTSTRARTWAPAPSRRLVIPDASRDWSTRIFTCCPSPASSSQPSATSRPGTPAGSLRVADRHRRCRRTVSFHLGRVDVQVGDRWTSALLAARRLALLSGLLVSAPLMPPLVLMALSTMVLVGSAMWEARTAAACPVPTTSVAAHPPAP